MSLIDFKNLSVLVTGASGFIGGHLVSTLLTHGAKVFNISRTKSPYIAPESSFVGNILDREFVLKVFDEVNPTYVFHLASSKLRNSETDAFSRSLNENVIGAMKIIEASERLPHLLRFVSLGTCEEYGDSNQPCNENMREAPVSAYSYSKLAVTNLLQTYWRVKAFPVTILRPSLAYGPGQKDDMFLPCLIQALLKGDRFPMSNGCQTRDFIYVDDLIDAILSAACCPDARGEIVNVCSEETVRIRDLALMVAQLVGKDAHKLLEIGKIENRQGEILDYRPENSKARKLLNWKPSVQLHDGLSKTIDFYRAQLSKN